MEYLKFDNQSGSFSINDVLIGAESGATCTVDIVVQDGSSGGFFTSDRVGDFIDGEIIYVASYGSELITASDDRDFTTSGSVNWANISCDTFDVTGGNMHLVADSQYDYARLTSDYFNSGGLQLNSFYKVLCTTSSYSSGTWKVVLYNDTSIGPDITTATTTTSILHCLDGTNNWVGIQCRTASGDATFDDISVKKITNAALVNGTIQSATPLSEGFMLGMLLDDAIGLNPTWEYQKDTPKNEYQSRPYEGNLFKTTLGSYKRFNFNIDFVTSEHMTIINSWWESGAELFFFITSDSVTEVNTVVLMNDESPINQYKQNTGYFKGSIELESY